MKYPETSEHKLKPSHTYHFTRQEGTVVCFLKDFSGPAPFAPFHTMVTNRVLKEKKETIYIAKSHNPNPGPRKPTMSMQQIKGDLDTGLFALNPEWPDCYIGDRHVKGEGKDKKHIVDLRETFLVQIQPKEVLILVFSDHVIDPANLLNQWVEGNIEGVEAPK